MVPWPRCLRAGALLDSEPSGPSTAAQHGSASGPMPAPGCNSGSYTSAGRVPTGTKSNSSEAGGSYCSLPSKGPSVATRSSAPAANTSVFDLSTSGLLSQRRNCILKPMISAYVRSSDPEVMRSLAQRVGGAKGVALMGAPQRAGSDPVDTLLSSHRHHHQPASALGGKGMRKSASAWSLNRHQPSPAVPSSPAGPGSGRGGDASHHRQLSGRGLPRAYSTCSVGSCAASVASGSLMAASFARMQGHLIAADAAVAVAIASGDLAGGLDGAQLSGHKVVALPALPVSADDKTTANRFAEAYLKAVRTGNGQWASDPEVAEAFDEAAKLNTHDGQKFVGRAAIVKRLNQGMQQFLKMVGQQANVGNEDATLSDEAARKMASKLQTQLEIRVLDAGPAAAAEGKAASAGAGRLRRGARAVNLWVKGLMLGGKSRRPGAVRAPAASGAKQGAAQQQQQQQPCVVVVYSFKYGIRKMTVTDTLRFKGGRIVRMKRSFKL